MFAHSLVLKRMNEQQAVAYKSSDSFSSPTLAIPARCLVRHKDRSPEFRSAHLQNGTF